METTSSNLLQLRLFGTSARFYRLTVTPTELGLYREELGTPRDRQVALRCRAASSGRSGTSSSVKLELVGHRREEERSAFEPGREREKTGQEGREEGSGQTEEGEGSAEKDWELEGSAMDGPNSGDTSDGVEMPEEATVTVSPFDLTPLSGLDEAEESDAHDLTEMHVFPAPRRPVKEHEVAHQMMMLPVPRAPRAGSSSSPVFSWLDGSTAYDITELVSGDDQTEWTADCPTEEGIGLQ